MIFNRDIIGNGDIYGKKFAYDEMIVMGILVSYAEQNDIPFDFEDFAVIAGAIYSHWIEGRSVCEDEKYAKYPWLEFNSIEEDHYISKYAYRVAPEFIELYQQEEN